MSNALKYELQRRPIFVVESVVTLEDYGDTMLKQTYALTGANTIEPVGIREDIHIWVDESGLLKEDNPVLEIFHKEWGRTMYLAGVSLILSIDDEGNSIGLNDEQIAWVRETLQFNFGGFTGKTI